MRRHRRSRAFRSAAVLAFLLAAARAAAVQPEEKWDGNRTSPVHQIPLKDEFDQIIVPTEPNPLPVSFRFSCEPCHSYSVIEKGLHFNPGGSQSPGRPGEPWIWVDEASGTQIPLSYKPRKGVHDPGELGLTPWDFTLMFGRHLAGGGISEPAGEDMTPGSRWEVSGKLEISCLTCHDGSRMHDHSEWAKQILRENFRWAATAAAGLGEVGGIASRLAPTWDIYDGPNPDDTEWAVAPHVKYRKNLFDGKHRAFVDINHKPDDSRCLACHSVTPVGAKKFDTDADVHAAGGLKCADCHRNDIRHRMIRGYEGEDKDEPGLVSKDFTCSGCHLGEDPEKGGKGWSGRMGAPYPLHKGIPQVHFKRLSCTACHSGPLPADEPARVRTARANRLGIFGIARWATDAPVIQEPVYVRGADGKLSPHRLMWPAFWGERRGKDIVPLAPERVRQAAGEILSPQSGIAAVLAALAAAAPDAESAPVLAAGGNTYELNVDGGLNVSAGRGEKPAGVFWAFKKDKSLTPAVPAFDPEATEIDPDLQARVQRILDALAAIPGIAGKPALVGGKALWQVTDGYLQTSENPGPASGTAEIVLLAGEEIRPLFSDFELKTVIATVGTEYTLTEEQVRLVLESLSGREAAPAAPKSGPFVYVSRGKVFSLNAKGKLVTEKHHAAEPVTWPLAHQVRPTRQSLGANGCKDCHSFNSPFLFAKVSGTGPLKTGKAEVLSAGSFTGLRGVYHRFFGLSFKVRPLLKVLLLGCFLVGAAIALLAAALALGRVTGFIERRR